MIIGGLRALILQSLHPLAMAGVAEHSDYRARPLQRLRRTAEYISTITFGDTEAARQAGATVRRVHRHINGTDPVTGKRYTAEDPDTLLWVHCVEVHSFLAGYRTYAGSVSPEDQDAYFAESARAAELVGIPADRVPPTRGDMRDYFASVRPSLCVSAAANDAIRFVVSPPITRDLLPLAAPLRIAASAAVGLTPRDLRRLAGIDRPWVLDAVTYAGVNAAVRPLALALRLPFAGDAGVEQIRRRVLGSPFSATTPRLLAERGEAAA